MEKTGVGEDGVVVRWRLTVLDHEIDGLHAEAFGEPPGRYSWKRCQPHSLGWVTAHEEGKLLGFANLAWDGDVHAFLIDVAVTPNRRHQAIGRRVVARAVEEAGRAGCAWVHVDYEERLDSFYRACGFLPTSAGLRRVS
jgi:GNAT superfamily N-acetyltransferase